MVVSPVCSRDGKALCDRFRKREGAPPQDSGKSYQVVFKYISPHVISLDKNEINDLLLSPMTIP
jgi:hypothetical protein